MDLQNPCPHQSQVILELSGNVHVPILCQILYRLQQVRKPRLKVLHPYYTMADTAASCLVGVVRVMEEPP